MMSFADWLKTTLTQQKFNSVMCIREEAIGHSIHQAHTHPLTWSNTWLLVALYFCAMASATAFGPMNSVFQL
jgi:hypothetical protein